MATKLNLSQLKSKLRQAQNKQKQAINNYNSAVRKYNQKIKQEINRYNNFVRQHNTKVKQNRIKIENTLQKLNRKSVFRISSTYTVSVRTVNDYYKNMAAYYDTMEYSNAFTEQFYESAEQENLNCLETANNILTNENVTQDEYFLQDTKIVNELSSISFDLNNRWKGALFALNSANPDATRHFCTSAREIFTEIFNLKSPDKVVFEAFPTCDKTPNGTPTRRAKIKYFLDKKGVLQNEAIDFVDSDIQNILELFHVLSDGTHGKAGKYSSGHLQSIKRRVEDGLLFLCSIVN